MPIGAAALAILALLVGVVPGAAQDGDRLAPDAAEPSVIYLVRHAETAPDGTRDPPLSGEGERRARWLGVVLSHARLDAVYTTEYRRTRATARVAASANGVGVTLYDPDHLQTLAAELRARRGRVLVVGHSNTTPALVQALGGEPGTPIDEDEFDRLYTLVVRDDSTRTLRLRY